MVTSLTRTSPWLKDIYGNAAADLLSQIKEVDTLVKHAVNRFYQHLADLPEAKTTLENLAEREFRNLLLAQEKYLRSLLDPQLTQNRHYQIASEAGKRHFYVGVSPEILAEAFTFYADIIQELICVDSQPDCVKRIVGRRIQFDLVTQIESYAWIESNRLNIYQKIGKTERTNNTLDFLQDSLSFLLDNFRGEITGIALGSVKNSDFRYLLAKGSVPYQADNEQIPYYGSLEVQEIVQAWFSEQPLVVNSVALDRTLSDMLKTECLKREIRSLCVVLIHDLQGVPKDCFLVCSHFPGYFYNKNTVLYWQQIADQIGKSLDSIDRGKARRLHRLSDGLRFRQLLAQEKVEMYYQPIVDPKSGSTVKIEALARLKDNDQIIAPGVFLSAFGSSQLRDLLDIGLQKVINDLFAGNSSKRSALADNLVCSINVPPDVMADKLWLKGLTNYLDDIGANPNRISLEILESALTDDKEIQLSLTEIKHAGYSILLDDVGAGESSLLRLATLPVSGIKIDQSFVRSLAHSFEYLDFILSMRSLAAQRGLECIAEGVETENIIDTLGCVNGLLLQGYAFAKPMPASDLANWLNREAEGKPMGPFPKSLFGWYCRHIERFINLRNALNSIPDLLSIEQIMDAEKCPLHSIIREIGGDSEIDSAHRRWHSNYACFTALVQEGANADTLWSAMEASKTELRAIMEMKLYGIN